MSTYLDKLSNLNEDDFDYLLAEKELTSVIKAITIDTSSVAAAHEVSDDFEVRIEELDAHNAILSGVISVFGSATFNDITLYGSPSGDAYGHYATGESEEYNPNIEVEILHEIAFEYLAEDKEFNIADYLYQIEDVNFDDNALYELPDVDVMINDAQESIIDKLNHISEANVKIVAP